MRLVHLSDLHIGYRQYQRLTPAGIKRAIDKTIELQPDFVLIAGDVFHSVRPSNPAILHAFLQFARLAESLPKARIVILNLPNLAAMPFRVSRRRPCCR